jgi:hypothetical protein
VHPLPYDRTGEPIPVVGQVANLPGQDAILPYNATVIYWPAAGSELSDVVSGTNAAAANLRA